MAALSAAPAPVAWCSVAPPPGALAPLLRRLEPHLAEAPQPLAHLHTEHTLASDPRRIASVEAERQLALMRSAALAWRAGAPSAYFDRAQTWMLGWMSVYQPDLNPIDETNLDALIDTYAMIKDRMVPSARDVAGEYLRRWARAYVADIDAHSAHPGGTWINNWQSHRIKLITIIAAATDDSALFAQARRLFWIQMRENVGRDGAVLDFTQRDALHYVIYDLEPLVQAALAARAMGEDWFDASAANGASLAQAVAWMRPYAAGEKRHQEFVHSTVAFDAERAAAGEKGYSGAFDPKTAGRLMWLAASFDPQYAVLAGRLSPEPPDFVALCGQ
jgi:hypothetical protein